MSMNHAEVLAAEFPEYRDTISQLKVSNNHFATVFSRYDEVVHELHRIEQELETPSDTYTEALKKKRLHLKDELFSMLQQFSKAA